ncbi:MAG: type IV toxin-antitoxin system AbiEi family antitoxin domain-containing protein [Coriobacteriales bacterium]|jgi:predicted transcriptional regulator of viral defense system|nr:type IV toxin-antitoxin system AbiEi family antitoxin domain-containing protein [Coriobacteriales bacterium]
MSKTDILDSLVQKDGGYIKTSDAESAGISRSYFGDYVRMRSLERVAHGMYAAEDVWPDGMYIIQSRFSNAVFSHETALFLLGLADREPPHYSVTLKAGSNGSALAREGIKVYKVREELFEEGLIETQSPAGHAIRSYTPERTLVDIVRSRSGIEIQDYQTAFKEYARMKGKNLPQLMRLAKAFSVEKAVRQYMEVLL